MGMSEEERRAVAERRVRDFKQEHPAAWLLFWLVVLIVFAFVIFAGVVLIVRVAWWLTGVLW